MTVNPSPMKRAFICPLCGTPIDAMTPEETRYAPAPRDWVPTSDDERQNRAEFTIAQNMAANEALIWAHFESHHSLREAVLALGVARNALMEVRSMVQQQTGSGEDANWLPEYRRAEYLEVINRGLDDK